MTFQKGQSGNPKGAPPGGNPGAGRPPDWLRKQCQEIVDRRKLLEFLGNVAGGENTEQVVTDQGEVLQVPAAVRDRLRATEMLLDRGYGKAEQSFKVEDTTGRPDKEELENALDRVSELAGKLGDLAERIGVVKRK